jgi:hypothetical protein
VRPSEERKEPAPDRPPRKDIAALTDDTTDSVTEVTSRDVLAAEIIALGPDALLAASLGWRLGRLDAEEIAKQRIAQAGREVACSPEWRAIRRWPSHAELERRRRDVRRRSV